MPDDEKAPEGYVWALMECDYMSFEYGEKLLTLARSIAPIQDYILENWHGGCPLTMIKIKTEQGAYFWYTPNHANHPEYLAKLYLIL